MTNTEILYVKCPTCNQKIQWSEDNPYRPFCCKRCQLIDFGTWANEENKIACDHPNDEDDMIAYEDNACSEDEDRK